MSTAHEINHVDVSQSIKFCGRICRAKRLHCIFWSASKHLRNSTRSPDAKLRRTRQALGLSFVHSVLCCNDG